MTTDFVADFDRRWDELDNTNRFGGGGYADLFAGSDVLICDGLSWLIEFQFLNRPVIFLERADHVAFNPVGQRIVEGTYRVHSVAEAIELAEHFARGGEHRLAATQREIMAELFGEGGVAGRILDTIREQIAVENAQNAGYLVGADLSSRESVTMMIRAEDRR